MHELLGNSDQNQIYFDIRVKKEVDYHLKLRYHTETFISALIVIPKYCSFEIVHRTLLLCLPKECFTTNAFGIYLV